ncbi:MAG: chitobiase/beta-hexosaminidase C-terminal domain-containing protein [Lachnospiraceae bacterium]|nr:chitobiase/beta-hexosaminidase C-terminal domain-containing protein [Lachnospiraceae bacterium]
MYRRIMSAFLVFTLLISDASMSVFAMPENTGINEYVEDVTSGDNASEDTITEENTSEDTISDEDTLEDTTAEDDATESNTTGDETIEDDSTEDDIDENDTSDDNDLSDTAQKDDSDDNKDVESETESEEESETEPESGAEPPSNSMTESFLVDTAPPYDGDYLLVANVSTDENGASESAGALPLADKVSSNIKNILNAPGIYALYSDDPDIYDFDENGMGLIDPDSFLPEPVLNARSIAYQASQEAAPIEYYIGYERNFYLNTTANNEYNSVDCVCVAISDYCTVWIPVDDPIYVADAVRMKNYMNELALEFDSQFPKMTEMFGSKETVDCKYGDNDGKTALICYDINGNKMTGSSYTAGYYYSADLNINYSNRTKNNIDCLHIDSWQGMNRNATNNTLDSVYSKRTMVHELQHMINFSICRDNENKFLQLKVPTYLNEAYSEAAAHLCYGEATSRISNYNTNTGISGGKVSLFKWGSYNTLSSYALSYLFSQYIRTQYEDDDTVYKDTMNALNESTDLFSVIADKLGVSGGELLFNFRAALFLKNAEGAFGFGGEKWAETIKSNITQPVANLSLDPGAAVIIPMSDTFEPDGAGDNIRFAGMYKELTTDAMSVKISGGNLITEDRGQLQLSVMVLPETISQSVIFFLPDSSDSVYAQVTTSGLVTAVSNGTVTVRASSVYNPSKYDDITITISGQQAIILEKEHTPVSGGISVKYSVVEPEGVVLYYTTNGELPTLDSEILPDEGLLFNTAGTHTLKVLAYYDPSETYRSVIVDDRIIVKQLKEPAISTEVVPLGDTYAQRITIKAESGAKIYYTTNGSEPSEDDAVLYNEPFTIDTPDTTVIRAMAVKDGAVSSKTARYEVNVNTSVDIEKIHTPMFDGVKVSYKVKAMLNMVLYYTDNGEMPTTKSKIMKGGQLIIGTAGTHTLKLLWHDPSGVYGDIYDEDVVVVEQLNDPVISTEEVSTNNVYTQHITIQADEGASIYYTTDGSLPTIYKANLYKEPFVIDTPGTVVIRAIAVKEGAAAGKAVRQDVVVQALASLEKRKTQILGGVKVCYEVKETPNMVLYYTTNGETPTPDSEIMSEEGLIFDAAGTYTLKVLAHDPEDIYREVYGEDITVIEQISEPEIGTETISASLGTQCITIQAQDGAVVYYTTDDSMPSMENGTKYEAPFTINTLGTTTINAVALKEGMAVSNMVFKEVTVQYTYEIMDESERNPYLTQVSLSLNKKAVNGTRFSILPIMENEIIDAKLVDYSDDFKLEHIAGTNDWEISLVNKNLDNKTYQTQVRVISSTADNVGYSDEIGIKLKITDTLPKVSLKAVTINTLYPAAGYPLIVTSISGNVEILGIANAQNIGFTDNFELRNGVLYLRRQYDEFVKMSNNKPVLSGTLQVQVEGYEPQEIAINVKTTSKAPKLIQSVSPIRLNYNKLQEEKSLKFTLDRQVSAKERYLLEDITSVTLNEKGGKNYQKASEFIEGISPCDDGLNIKVDFKDIKSGTYTLPLLVSAGTDTDEDSFSDVSCNVTIVIDKENVEPVLKLSTTKLKLNRQTSGEKAYIAVNSVSQYNMELADIKWDYVGLPSPVNSNKNVSLYYDADKRMMEAKIIGESALDTYKFVCTPYYNKVTAQDGTTTDTPGNKINVTVTLINKAPSVTLKAKGSIDVLNRDTTSVSYTIKKVNFTDEIEAVKFKQASKLTDSILDARKYFNYPVLNEDSTVTISAKEDAADDVHHFTKGMKYAFRLEFTLRDSKTADMPDGITVETKDITITPKQSKVKLNASSKPVFYTYVNTGNNTKAVTLLSNNGIIDKVEWNTDANKKVPAGITPVFDDDGRLTGVTFDGNGTIKKGTYKLTFNVYYKGQFWEKETSRKASYCKPTVFKLTVSVK